MQCNRNAPTLNAPARPRQVKNIAARIVPTPRKITKSMCKANARADTPAAKALRGDSGSENWESGTESYFPASSYL